MIDTTLAKNLLERIFRISALSSGKIGKYEYLTGEEILPLDQIRVIEHAKFTYSPLGEAFEKQKKFERQGEKQIKAIEEHGKELVESNALIENTVMMLKKITQQF